MAERIRCQQCWRKRPASFFVGARKARVQWCSSCRARRTGGTYRRAAARRGLSTEAALRVLFTPASGNRKLGRIPTALVSSSTCPPTCGFYGKGCFAEFHLLRTHWARVPDVGLTWPQFCERVAELPEGQLWRYAEAGDLPGRGTSVDVESLLRLCAANTSAGARAFTFTHKPLSSMAEIEAVWLANRQGFTVNLSADSLADADARAELECGPVVVVVPSDAPRGLRTPEGRHVVLCPAESHGLTCARCQLCANPTRKSVVGFRAHGQLHKLVSRIARGPTTDG